MPVYEYKAVDSTNKTRKGMVDADSPREARLKLRSEQSLFVTDLNEAKQRGRRRIAIKGVTGVDAPDRRRNEQIAAVTRQMASLLGAGIPLAEGLRMVIEQAQSRNGTLLRTAAKSRRPAQRLAADGVARTALDGRPHRGGGRFGGWKPD